MVKFSVLIPTRNRLQYLKLAIDSILQQDYEDFEIIISDNDSEEDIKSYVNSLADSRIQYFRTSTFLPVTENWNRALEKSSGDYVIMLGDDDGLMQGYFKKVLNLINEFDAPDLFYTSAYLFAYPHVLSDFPQGLLNKWGNAEFLEGKTKPYILDQNKVLGTVKKSMQFKVLFNFNAQFATISRSLIQELQKYGSFYQSPYPDYYVMTALLLKAKKVLVVPDPLVIVGITPKSFGYYYFNQKEQEGVDFLNNYPDQSILNDIKRFVLPGTQMNTSWLLSLETVKRNFGKEYGLEVNYNRYRLLQMLYYFKNYACEKNVSLKDVWKMSKNLFWWEKAAYLIPFLIFSQGIRRYPNKKKRDDYIHKFVSSISHPSFTMKRIDKPYNDISEIINSPHYNDAA